MCGAVISSRVSRTGSDPVAVQRRRGFSSGGMRRVRWDEMEMVGLGLGWGVTVLSWKTLGQSKSSLPQDSSGP
eukprot:360633-Chlamydomonas_euryale.AAC.9